MNLKYLLFASLSPGKIVFKQAKTSALCATVLRKFLTTPSLVCRYGSKILPGSIKRLSF